MSGEAEYRCFIGGLSWETTDRDLENAFRPYGDILEAKVVINRDTGRSKGFGFVTFREERELQEAIDQMHGMKLDGRPITVDKAQGKAQGGSGSGSRGSGGGGSSDGCFKCGQAGHWARDCPSGGGGGRRDSYSSGRDDRNGKGDRYGSSSGGRYGSDRSGDRYGGGRSSTNRENGARDRYNGGGPSRNDSGGHRDRSGPYDRESGGKHGGGSARNDSRGHRNSYEDRG